jgi:glycosyltransferase involved in cell wall biosynthesis
MVKVCHLSSVHRGLDIRIYRKQCVSLAAAGFDVHLVIAATPAQVAEAAAAGVTVHALPGADGAGRLQRVLRQGWRCYRMAAALDADLYHFHDPELIPYGLLLRRHGKRVVYDLHEDLPADILSKPWIPARLRGAVGAAARSVENLAARRLSALVAATPHIGAAFERHARQITVVRNYPILQELHAAPAAQPLVRDRVCYVGAITATRGIGQAVRALEHVPVRLLLAGQFETPALRAQVQRLPGWRQVDECGVVDRAGVARVMARSFCGLVTLLPEPNYLNALPIKLFEYMAAGLPVVASDFPLWRAIVDQAGCGLCVDPEQPEQIAAAIAYLRTHPAQARHMGENGRRAVQETYRWEGEAVKLAALYRAALGVTT